MAMHESMSRNIAPLSFSFLAIAMIVVLGAMAPSGPAADEDDAPPRADAGPDFHVGPGDTVILDGTRSSDDLGVSVWQWTFEHMGENVTLEGARVPFTFDEPGTYPVVLKVIDTDGHWSTDVVLVRVGTG